MKRFLSVFMALAIIFASAFAEFPPMSVTAQAATNGVQAKIDTLLKRYPSDTYFSANGQPCNHGQSIGCDNCNIRYIKPGNGLPDGNVACNYDRWSCVAFATYVYYYIFGHINTVQTTTLPAKSTPSLGDIIVTSGHWSICAGQIDSDNWYVYESNYITCNLVKYKKSVVNRNSIQSVYHATNYDDINGGHTHNYQFKYFLEAHPHCDYNECSSCGDGYTDTSSSRFYAAKGCSQCCATITAGTYYFVNKGTGKALNLENNVDANKTNVHMYDLSLGYPSQQMVVSVRSSTDNSYKIRPTSSSRLVQPFGDTGVTTSGMNVNIYDDVNDNTQWWHFQAVSDGYVIRNAANTSCVLTASNGDAIVSTYTGSNNQIWTLQSSNQKYTIAYNANGGSGTMANTEMTVGTAANLRANAFTRTGHSFVGWSASASATTATYTDKQSVKDLAKSGTVTLYAVWKPNTYTVIYNANGGLGTMANTSMTYDTTTNLRTNAFTRTGYTFLGWSSSSSATTVTYTDKQSVKNLATSGTVTLYAVWAKNQPVGKLMANDSTIYIGDNKETYIPIFLQLYNDTKKSHVKFTYTWDSSILFMSGCHYNPDDYPVNEDVWEDNYCDVTFSVVNYNNSYIVSPYFFAADSAVEGTTYLNISVIEAYDDEGNTISFDKTGVKITIKKQESQTPEQVTGFTGTANTNSIALKWNNSANATSYELQQQINGSWKKKPLLRERHTQLPA